MKRNKFTKEFSFPNIINENTHSRNGREKEIATLLLTSYKR